MRVDFYGGKQAGMVGLLTVLAHGDTVEHVIAYGSIMEQTATMLGLPVLHSYKEITSPFFAINVHGREIIPFEGVNVHPCLYCFKGVKPVKKFLSSEYYPKASVGLHWLAPEVDGGEVIEEIFVNVEGLKTEIEVYNALYPYYSKVLFNFLENKINTGRVVCQTQG